MALGINPSQYPITGGYPFLNIAKFYNKPYETVLADSDLLGRRGVSAGASRYLFDVFMWNSIERARKEGTLNTGGL